MVGINQAKNNQCDSWFSLFRTILLCVVLPSSLVAFFPEPPLFWGSLCDGPLFPVPFLVGFFPIRLALQCNEMNLQDIET